MIMRFHRVCAGFFFAVFLTIISSSPAFAGATNTVNDVANNMVTSSEDLPGLVAALSYLLGLALGVWGIFSLKDHVENPQQAPLRQGVVRLLAGGALFALPIIYETVLNTIGNNPQSFDNNAIANDISGFLGTIGGIGGLAPNINGILENIRDSISEVPGLIAAVAYLLGLIIAVQAILKAKDHVENPGPNGTQLKESVIRFLVAGALFALPTIYNAMFDVVGGNGLGIIGSITSIFAGAGFLFSSYAGTLCNPIAGFLPTTVGDSLCGIILHAGAFPAFLTAISYLIGLILGVWGIFKIRDHVLNPQQTQVWEGVSRLVAGGFFFALPVVVEVMRATFIGTAPILSGFALFPTTGFNTGAGPACGAGPLGLDGTLVCMMQDVMGPLHVVLNFAAFVAGMILLMIGVSRLIKSAQDGARGPGGLGTVMTFVTGAALISYNELVRAFSTTIMGSPVTLTFNKLQYTTGMSAAEVGAANAVIAAIVQFVVIVGLISFVRGIFIIRGVAEGNQQSSVMAGVTHMVGGALAVNLGPLINAVQTTLGLGGFGITFGGP